MNKYFYLGKDNLNHKLFLSFFHWLVNSTIHPNKSLEKMMKIPGFLSIFTKFHQIVFIIKKRAIE